MKNGQDPFLQNYTKKPPVDVCWVISQSGSCEIVNNLVESAPGPDGIRYSAWSKDPYRVKQILYVAYRSWIAGHALPEDFNYAFLCLLAKEHHVADADRVLRPADNTRPLSRSNSDENIFAMCLKGRLEGP
eukprot:12423413-Karenia_brevis.AAC.1